MANSSTNEKLSLLAELVKLAQTDLQIRTSEFEFLQQIAQQLGVSESDFHQVFEKYIAFTPPKFEFDRIVQLHRLVLLMNVDQDTNEKEISLIKNLGMRLGLNSLAIAEVLKVMHQFPNKVIPPDILISIFKTYHN